MHWRPYQVTEDALEKLCKYNQPIPVANGLFEPNSGVELFTLTGKVYNAIYDPVLGAIRQLNGYNPQFDSMPNRDLLLYNDLLLNPDVNTVIVNGFFGTGKTSIVCSHLVHGLMQRYNGGEGIPAAYLSKPHESLGKSYGHLPGDLMGEKTKHEFKSFTQYFDRFGQPYLADELMSENMLHILVFEYLRGIDIERGWVILDEAQNTDKKEIISFISRLEDPVKVIVLGDSSPYQIDKSKNSVSDNGLAFAIEAYRGKKYAGVVELNTEKHILRGRRVKDLLSAIRG